MTPDQFAADPYGGQPYPDDALTDKECDAIYYARANNIHIGNDMTSHGRQRDRALIRAGYRAGAARVGIAREWPKVLGVCRMTTATKSLQVVFEDRPTDREMDAFDAILRAAAREQPPQREADTGGAATDGQPDSEQA